MAGQYDISASLAESTAVNSAAGPTASGGFNYGGANFNFAPTGSGSFIAPTTSTALKNNLIIASAFVVVFVAYLYFKKGNK